MRSVAAASRWPQPSGRHEVALRASEEDLSSPVSVRAAGSDGEGPLGCPPAAERSPGHLDRPTAGMLSVSSQRQQHVCLARLDIWTSRQRLGASLVALVSTFCCSAYTAMCSRLSSMPRPPPPPFSQRPGPASSCWFTGNCRRSAAFSYARGTAVRWRRHVLLLAPCC